MTGPRCLSLVAFLLLLNGLGATTTEKIPLGAIFEQGTEEVQSAFKFAMLNHNINMTTRKFELQAFVDVINTADAFKLSKLICNQFSRGVYSMLGAVSPDSFDTLHSYSNTFQMPFVTPWFPEKVTTPSSGFLDFAISMRPDYHQAIIDTIAFYGWKKIIYLYDSHDGLLRLQQIYQSLQPGSESFKVETVQRIANVSAAIGFLRRLEEMDRWSIKYIVLDCPTEMAKEIIVSHVRDVVLGRRNYHYLLSGLIMDDQWETQVIEYGAINITGFRIVDHNRKFVKDFLVGWGRLDPSSSKGAGKDSISAQAALMYDAVFVLVDAFTKLLKKKPDLFRAVGSKKVAAHMMSTSAGAGINSTGIGGNGGGGGSSMGAIAGGGGGGGGVRGAECNITKTLIDAWEHGDKISRYLRKVEIEGLTGVIRFNEDGRRVNYSLSVVEMSVNSAMVKVAEWSDESKFMSIAAKFVRLHTGKELPQNRSYVVTTILEEPYVMLRPRAEGGAPLVGNNRFEGYCKDLADLVAERTGITYEMRVVADGNYGSENAFDGSWDGMVGELVGKKADIAIAPMTITSERERVIDFSKPFMSLGISIMIKKPVKQKPGVFSFLSPLSTEIWICVIFSYVGVSVVLFIVSRFSPYEWRLIQMNGEPLEHLPVVCGAGSSVSGVAAASGGAATVSASAATGGATGNAAAGAGHHHQQQQPSVNEFSIMNSLWFALGAFMQQGCDISPRSISGRIVGSVWWFFTLILISSYTANLAAFLTVERMVTNINSPEDLAAQSEVQYGTIMHGSTREFFRRSSLPIYSRMWEYMSAHPGVFAANYTDGIQRVRNAKGKYALLVESPKNDYTNERQPCDTMKVGDNLDMKGFGIATPLHSPLREGINLAVLSLIEDGNMTRLKNKWWFERSECPASDKQDAHNELSLSNVAGIFFILIAGLCVALVVALVEFCMTPRKDGADAVAASAASGGCGGAQKMAAMSSMAPLKSKTEHGIQAAQRDGYDNGRGVVVGFDKQVFPTHQYYAANNGPMTHHDQDTIHRRGRPHPTKPIVM